jgi:trigger factor
VKVSVEKLPGSEAVLNVDITWDELEKASNKAYRKLVQKVDIQGFRRGKAPRSLLERRLGKEYIYQEGLDELISEAYRNAVKEHELTPIAQPELDAPDFEMGQPYHFSLKVPVVTPAVLGDYKSLHFEREESSVTSEEVEQEIENLRNRVVKWDEVERPAEYNDRVIADLTFTVDEKTISNLKDHTFELTQERYGMFVGLDEHIVGMSAGESKEFTTTLPADYSNKELAGKEGQYAVTVHKVEAKEVPEIDDQLAAQVSDGQYENMEDLRKAVSDNILERKKRAAREGLREKVINAVIEQAQITIHPLLVQEEAEHMLHQFSHVLEQQHMSLDQYLKIMRKTKEEYLQELQPEAEARVRRELVLDALAEQEQIGIAPEEVEALFNAYEQMGQRLERSDAQIRALAVGYRREKTMSRLVELTAGPDPDTEQIPAEDEEANIVNAEAAVLASEDISDGDAEAVESDQHSTTAEAELPAETTSGPSPVDATIPTSVEANSQQIQA